MINLLGGVPQWRLYWMKRLKKNRRSIAVDPGAL
jgi:hypothetical protein